MRLSCVFALGLTVIGLSVGAERTFALDVQHNLRHSKTLSHHVAARHSATHHSLVSAPTPIHHVRASASASLHHAVITRRHHGYYERFTASSFASGDIFSADVTAGEDPVVRQAAIDALGDMNGTAVV